MSGGDATAGRADGGRVSPFEMGLPDGEFARECFGLIAEEIESREADGWDPGAFLLLGQVGRAVRELREGEGGAELLRTMGAFLFHAFHFDRARRPLYEIEKGAARYLVESNPVPEGWDRSLPAPSGYLRLPEYLFWTRPDEEGPAEAVDGIFWTASSGASLSLLVVTGMRPDRAGFSVIPLDPVPMADAGAWIERPARDEGVDFETTLPGGELDRLYSLETAGEVLKLAARALGYIQTVPGAVAEPGEGGEPGEDPVVRVHRVRLSGER